MARAPGGQGRPLTLERIRSDIKSINAQLGIARIDGDHERIGELEIDLENLRGAERKAERLAFHHDLNQVRRKGR